MNSDELREYVKYFVENKNTKGAISIIRKSGICICEYGTGKAKDYKLYKELMGYIKSNYNDIDEISEFEKEVKTLNKIFKLFNENRIRKIEREIKDEYELNAYLISLELNLREIYSNTLKDNRLTSDEKLNLEDAIKVSTGNVLSYLVDFKKCKVNTDCFIEEKYIQIAEAHIFAATEKNFLRNTKDLWCYYDVKVREIDNVIYINNNNLLALGKNISQLTFLDMRTAKMSAYLMKQVYLNNVNLDVLDTEELSKKFLFEDLFIDNLSTEIKSIPIEYYIRAYSIISKKAEEFIGDLKRIRLGFYKLEDFCMVKCKGEWSIIFEEAGIPKKYIDGIIKFLTFNKKSRDLMDSPFLCFGDKVITVPSVMLGIDASRTTLLNAAAKNLDIRFKGDYLEDYIHSILKNVDIKVTKFKRTVNQKETKSKDTFECDAIFKLDDTLYFLEIKHWFVPINYRDFSLYKDELEETDIQLNRIVKHYTQEKQMKEIMAKLNCSKPKKVRKIILTNIPYSGTIKFEGTIITDTVIFEGYFKRRPPNKIKFNKEEVQIEHLNHKYYKGEINSEQFEALLRDMPLVSYQASRIYSREYKMNFGININIKDYFFETFMHSNESVTIQ